MKIWLIKLNICPNPRSGLQETSRLIVTSNVCGRVDYRSSALSSDCVSSETSEPAGRFPSYGARLSPLPQLKSAQTGIICRIVFYTTPNWRVRWESKKSRWKRTGQRRVTRPQWKVSQTVRLEGYRPNPMREVREDKWNKSKTTISSSHKRHTHTAAT